MSKSYLIPHPNVPTSDIGISKMKDVTMLFNENFAALDEQVQANASGIEELGTSKADADHNHDDDYAAKTHTHSVQEVNSLEELLSLKAALVHTHDQYLTEVPTHSHLESEVDGLLEDLAAKADADHRHNISDVNGLDSSLADKATQSQLIALSQQMVKRSGNATNGHAIMFSVNGDSVTVTDAGVYAPGQGQTGDTVLVTGGKSSIDSGNLIKAGTDPDLADSGISSEDVSAVVDAFTISNDEAEIKIDNIPTGTTGSTVALGDHNHDDDYAEKSTETTVSGHTTTLADHESRIDTLEAGGGEVGAHSHGNITNVGVISGSNGHIIVGASSDGKLTSESITTPSGYSGTDVGYLNSIASQFDYANGAITLSTDKLKYPSDGGHSNDCFLTVNSNGYVVHGGNEQYNKITKIQSVFGYEGNDTTNPTDAKLPHNKITIDVGSVASTVVKLLGISGDETATGKRTVETIDGLPSTNVSIGNDASGGDVYLNSLISNNKVAINAIEALTANKIVKTNASGVLSTGDITISDLPMGTTSAQVAYGNHTHAYGSSSLTGFGTAAACNSTEFAPASTVSFPGLGTTHTTAAYGDHTHTHSGITDFDTAVDSRIDSDDTLLRTTDKRTPSGTGSLLSTDDVCAAGVVVPCGSNHCVPSSNHKHKPGSIGLNDSASTNLTSWIKSGTTNINGEKVVFSNSSGEERVAVISSAGQVSASDAEYAELTDTAPSSVGTTNTLGSSTEAARADHIHALPEMYSGDQTPTTMVDRAFHGDYYTLSFYPPIFDKYGRYKGLSSTAKWSINLLGY